MKRKPTFAPYVGSISWGLMSTEDLIPIFTNELAWLLRQCRVDCETRKAHTAILRHVDGAFLTCQSEIDYTLEKLSDALEHYAPPYTRFGARKGDGADFGFWPSETSEQLPRMTDWAAGDTSLATLWGHEATYVSPHGELGCGRFDRRGRWHEYWKV